MQDVDLPVVCVQKILNAQAVGQMDVLIMIGAKIKNALFKMV